MHGSRGRFLEKNSGNAEFEAPREWGVGEAGRGAKICAGCVGLCVHLWTQQSTA